MAQAFISYSSKDKNRVDDFVADLENLGQKVWFDDALTGGQEWWDMILNQVEQCHVFIMIITKNYLESDACRREYQYALALQRNMIPIMMDRECNVNLFPPQISKLQIVDYSEGSKTEVFALNKAINSTPAALPLPDPMPARPEIPISYVAGLLEEIRSTESLSYDQQIAIVFKLRKHLEDTGDSESVADALGILSNRKDLLAKVKEEMDDVLTQTKAKTTSNSKPPKGPITRKPIGMKSLDQQTTQIRPTISPAYSAPSVSRETAPKESLGLVGILAFLFPIIGFVLAGVWWSENPTRAKKALGAGLLGVFLYMFLQGMTY